MNPLLSIITVCRNAREDLLRTRNSVLQQQFRNFEWLIIDSVSTDGTADLFKEMDPSWVTVVSEPDEGIYDAMNKGLRLSRGEWIWFLNAGDCFYDANTTGKLASIAPEIDICFGDVLVVNRNGPELGLRSRVSPHELPASLEISRFRRGMVVSHQAFVARRTITPEFQDSRYSLSADLDWMLTILEIPRKSQNLGPLARVIRQGASLDRWHQSQYERFCILTKHFGLITTLINHVIIAFRRIRHGLRTRFWK